MNCIVYLVRSSAEDVEMFNRSLDLLEKNLLAFTKDTDVLVYVEESFEEYMSSVKTNLKLRYETITFEVPDYPEEIANQIPLMETALSIGDTQDFPWDIVTCVDFSPEKCISSLV
jgi:hypothetical protein